MHKRRQVKASEATIDLEVGEG